MSEYINIEILLWVCGAIGITWIVAYFVIEERVKQAYAAGKADLGRQIVKTESYGYRKGYLEGKDAGIFMGKSHVQKVGPKTTKTPAKQPSKPSNNGRTQVAANKRKPAAKKPT